MDAVNETEQVAAAEPSDNAAAASDPAMEQDAPPQRTFEEEMADADRMQAEIEQRDREFLDALDEVLTNRVKQKKQEEHSHEKALERFTVGVVKKGVGVISLSLILVFMGVVMICCLFSSAPDYLLPLKLSPVAAILIGLELLISNITNQGHFRVNIPSICISALVVVGCCAMCVALNNSYSMQKVEYNNRSIAAEIYDSSYKELRYVAQIATLTVDVDLNPDNSGRTQGIESLSYDDYVTITAELSGDYANPKEFAYECKAIIDCFRIMGIPITDYHFKNESLLHSFKLDVIGKYEQDYSESELVDMVNHVYLEDYDYIEDLEDFIDYTEETATAE